MERTYRHVLVTGASSGLGRGLAAWFARRGATVYAAARREAELAALAKEVVGVGRIVPLPLDVADAQAVRARIAAADAEVGGFDLVIANAGVSYPTRGSELQWESIAQILSVNVVGAAATLAAVLPGMVARNSGHVVGISSLAGLAPLPGFGAYGASKAFLTHFLESLRLDLAGTDVRVTSIHPGFVKSAMTANNRFRMPFLLETEDAVGRMGRAIVRQRPRFYFPWPLALAARLASMIPFRLLGVAARRIEVNPHPPISP